jgi:hypothetical protein
LLFPPPLSERLAAADASLPWGGLTTEADALGDWLDAGAGVMALLDGATVANLERLRSVIDDYERVGIEAERTVQARWEALVARGAAMAPGGAAAWVGSAPTTPLPAGFTWLTVSPHEAARLPLDHFRLVVANADPDPGSLAHTLERGGVLVGPAAAGSGLRVLVVDEAAEPALAIYRREE